MAMHLVRQIGMVSVLSIIRPVCDAVRRGRRSYFCSSGLGTATPSTPLTPHTEMDAWNIRINEVTDYEIVQDGNNHILWRDAKEADLACDRHPYRGSSASPCSKTKCLVCHRFKEEAKGPGTVGQWVWNSKATVDILNPILDHLHLETRTRPIWLARHTHTTERTEEHTKYALQVLEKARGRNTKTWKKATHLAMSHWTLKQAKAVRSFTDQTTVKIGHIPGGDDDPPCTS